MNKDEKYVQELKDEWRKKLGVSEYIKKGDYIGFPLSEIKIGRIEDMRDSYGDNGDYYPYEIVPDYYKEKQDEDMILILQYLGNAEFLELVSGRTILCWDSDSIPEYEHKIFSPSKSALEFAEQIKYFRENPLMLYNLEEYAFSLSDELKVLYANTTLKNQSALISKLDDMAEESKERITEGIREMATKDHEHALQNNENEIFDVDRFIESHGRKIIK